MYKAAVITASDSGAAGTRADKSGPVIAEMLQAAGYVVEEMLLLPDDREALAAAMRRICDAGEVSLLLTTGGTGFSPRDCTRRARRMSSSVLRRVSVRPCAMSRCKLLPGLCSAAPRRASGAGR